MTLTDPLDTVVTILTSGWTSGNTDSITPDINQIFDIKRIQTMTGTVSSVLCYEQKAIPEMNGIGSTTRRRINPVSVDIRTSKSRAHFIKLLKEVERIWAANIINPDANFDILDPDEGWIDLSDRRKKLWRAVYDIKLIKLNEAR